jgi:hypothetical protein
VRTKRNRAKLRKRAMLAGLEKQIDHRTREEFARAMASFEALVKVEMESAR